MPCTELSYCVLINLVQKYIKLMFTLLLVYDETHYVHLRRLRFRTIRMSPVRTIATENPIFTMNKNTET